MTKQARILLYITSFLFLSTFLPLQLYAKSTSVDSKQLILYAQQSFNEMNHKASLDYAHMALSEAYKTNDKILTAQAYNIIALNYNEFIDKDRVISIYTKAYNLVKNSQEYQLQFDILNNLASVYKATNPTIAIEYYTKALIIDQTKIQFTSILFCKINVAEAYYFLKQVSKGYELLKSIEHHVLSSSSNSLLMHFHLLTGKYFDFINQFSKAQLHYNRALLYLNSESDIPQKAKHKIGVYNTLADFYEKNDMREWSYFYLKKSLDAREDLYTVDYSQTIANYASKIDDEEYKREIFTIEKLNEQQKQTLFYTRVIYCLFFLIAAFLLINVLYLVKNQRQKNKLIDEIEEQNIALELAKKRAEEVADMKSQFISKVSHELRTPLYSVIGLTSILEQDFESLRNNKIVNALKSSSNYLMNLINDLLQLQKIEAKALKIEVQPYDIQSEINSITTSLQSIALKNNNQIHTVFKGEHYKLVETDKAKLNQILFNLLSNALKFTKNGHVTITIIQKIINDKQLELHVSVADTGIGISNENIKKVFKKFVQFHTKNTDYQGTGLGLSIVKQLVLLLGGKISVSSQLGLGTTFSFFIPAAISAKAKIEATNSLIAQLNLDLISILLVENNEINRLVNKRIFKNHNIDCKTVESGFEALKAIEIESFDVILTDISMPEMDGFEMTRIIRTKGYTMPIIALTAYNKEDILEKTIQSGINDVVTKPFDFDILMRVIYSNLETIKKG